MTHRLKLIVEDDGVVEVGRRGLRVRPISERPGVTIRARVGVRARARVRLRVRPSANACGGR